MRHNNFIIIQAHYQNLRLGPYYIFSNTHIKRLSFQFTLFKIKISKNITSMSKDFFQRNVDLMNDLRTQQFKIRQYLQRGKYRMKQKFFNKGKKHYDFDLNSQQYFHEQLYDVIFQNSQIQQQFNSHILKFLQQPCQFKNHSQYRINGIPPQKNQSEVRHQLYRFFNNRVHDLQYEKYLITQRLHNINVEQEIQFVKSRLNLIDKQIQMAISRSDRLSCQDYFQQTYTMGGKPVPINQNGQSIYKYLDEEECWYSNIHRDDIIIYSRNKLYKRELLHKHFYPLYYEHKFLVKTKGLDMLLLIEEQIARKKLSIKQHALSKSKKLINLFEEELELISPGNLIEKQNISTFIYYAFGAEQDQVPLNLPLYPALYLELLDNYNGVLPYFFKNLQIKQHKELIALMPKFNNFCAILFKYQNKEVLEGKQEIKLGLEDDIDIKKELHTMLEEIWVNKYVKIQFQRFDIRYRLQTVDWPLDTFTQEHSRQKQHAKSASYQPNANTEIKTLINILKSTNYASFRKHLKKHSEVVMARIKDKFAHMERLNKYNVLNDEEHTLQQLGEFFRIKFNDKQTHSESILKDNATLFFNIILKKHIITNPVQIEIEETLRVIKLRQSRVKLIGILNGMRCYHRNLALDLRVISDLEFSFQLDDEMLINSNKQVLQNFQKAVKDTQTFFSKESNESNPIRMTEEQFVQHHTYEKSKLYKRDRVSYQYFGEEIPHVLVSHGRRLKNKILYDIALQDTDEAEQRMLVAATTFINRYERYIKIKSLDEIVDRVDMLSRIYDLQLEYQLQKLKLIEAYYFIYENTKEPLQAFKLSRTIVQLVNTQPTLDLQQTSFEHAYQLATRAMREEIKVIKNLTNALVKAEDQNSKTFHDKFARSQNIPLTLLAFLYGDLQKRGSKNATKLQRMNSMSSKISKESRNKDDKHYKIHNQIREQFPEAEESEEQDDFDLQKYDEYLLRKNMDAIFDDMMGDEGNQKEAVPVNTVAFQNLIVSPRFEGGPHIKTNIFPEIPITSQKKQNLINFTEIAYVIGNVRQLATQLQQQFQKQYGFVSTLYQLAFTEVLAKKMYECCLVSQPLPPKWISFQTDDPYHQTVTKCMRYYEETMTPCLQPPSIVQLAIPSTYQRHYQKMPVYGALQYFDYHSIHSLITLKKPVNTFRYKQHNLGIGFVQLLDLQEHAWLMQLERRELSKSYQNLGKHCDTILERSVSEYTNTGQSQVFLAVQENKLYNTDIGKFPIYPDMLEQIREYFNCEMADIEVFRKHLQLSKLQLQDLVIMKYEIDKNFQNKRLDKTRMLAPKDIKDIKKIKNRILGMISIRAGEVLKNNTFLRYKSTLKSIVETKLKAVNEEDYDKQIEHKDKITPFCMGILTSKYRRAVQIALLQSYSKDLVSTAGKLSVATETLNYIKKLQNYAVSVPFLGTIFTVPTQNKLIDLKILYDQAKSKKVVSIREGVLVDGQINNVYYIYTAEQYFDEWMTDNSFGVTASLQQFSPKVAVEGLNPPAGKEKIFKWAFKIPDMHADANERDAVNHLVKVMHSFTGKLTQPSYRREEVFVPEPARNKYYNLMLHYKGLVEYIQANILLISLQVEQEVLYSLQSIIKKKINFEERYFMSDENSIRQTINTLENQDLSVVFSFFIDFAKMNKQVEQKIIDRHYLDKKEHWVVHDQIIDFMMSKIQGYGLIRKSYLPLCDDLKTLQNSKSPLQYLTTKTGNIYKLVYLAAYETYLNQINEAHSDYHAYHHRLNEWLTFATPLQDYRSSQDTNCRAALSPALSQDEDEKERFHHGIYPNDSNMLNDRMKYICTVPAHDIHSFLSKIIDRPHTEHTHSYLHNPRFLPQAIALFKQMGESNRFQTFARLRYHYDLGEGFLQTRSSSLSLLDKQIQKSQYYELMIAKKTFTFACIAFSSKARLPVPGPEFKESYMEVKQINQIQTHNLFQNLDRYREENKVQFSKLELALIGRNEGGNDEQHNLIIKEVIACKLLREEFRFRVLGESIRLLRAERVPKTEPKRIVNASLIPRVHLISSYSSPLMVDRKTYISQQYKLSFLQAFINRFRNKVSRVDLLSSGYGFVITVPDLQDCVNYMNKLLFTFTEKEFKHRIQTFSQYYEVLIEAINDKNKLINEQQALIRHLQQKNAQLLEAEYLSKVTRLLHEKTLVEDKLLTVENNINGLEDRVRKTVQIQYDKKINKLQEENAALRDIFTKVKHLHMVNTKETAKNQYLDIINYYRTRINELLNKKVDFTISFDDNTHTQHSLRVTDQPNADKYRQSAERQQSSNEQERQYYTQDLQRCKLGEEVLFDPYYATKLINKMRLFNLFRLGSKRIKFQEEQKRSQQKVGELSKIQDMVVAQSEREILVRSELTKIQEELSRKCLQLQRLKQSFESVENEKTKLKILMQSKEKKIEQKDREIDELKARVEEKEKERALQLQEQTEREKTGEKTEEGPKLSVLRKERKFKKVDRSAFLTGMQVDSGHSLSLYEKFQLSSKDTPWRQKCEQLYVQNKRLLGELERYQSISVPSTPKREGLSLNLRNRRDSQQESAQSAQKEPRFPNISFKYGILKQ